MIRYCVNHQFNGVEIYFDTKPSSTVISELKIRRWRWLQAKKCWYNANTPSNLEYAKSICSSAEHRTTVHSQCNDVINSNSTTNTNLVECIDCRHIVSIHAHACPFCGCPLSYTMEQYSLLAREKEIARENAEKEAKRKKDEEQRIFYKKSALNLISTEFQSFFEEAMNIRLSPETISEDELELIESEYSDYSTYLRYCEATISEKKACLIKAIGFQSWETVPYRLQTRIIQHFQAATSTSSAFNLQADDIQPDLFIANAVRLAFADSDSQYSAWVQRYCLENYSKHTNKPDIAIKEVPIESSLADDIAAINGFRCSQKDYPDPKKGHFSAHSPTVKKAKNLDILVYKNALSETAKIKINTIQNELHKKYIGLRVGDAFLDSNGYRCVVVDIIHRDPFEGWTDLAPTLSVDNYPSVNFGHKRKWNQ